MNKHNRNRLINTEIRLMVARRERDWGLGKKGEGIKKYKLILTKQSRDVKVQQRKCSQ